MWPGLDRREAPVVKSRQHLRATLPRLCFESVWRATGCFPTDSSRPAGGTYLPGFLALSVAFDFGSFFSPDFDRLRVYDSQIF